MRKRLVRALIFVAVAVGAAVGGASAAGALDFDFGGTQTAVGDGTHWD
jgi:hypothetical protein